MIEFRVEVNRRERERLPYPTSSTTTKPMQGGSAGVGLHIFATPAYTRLFRLRKLSAARCIGVP